MLMYNLEGGSFEYYSSWRQSIFYVHWAIIANKSSYRMSPGKWFRGIRDSSTNLINSADIQSFTHLVLSKYKNVLRVITDTSLHKQHEVQTLDLIYLIIKSPFLLLSLALCSKFKTNIPGTKFCYVMYVAMTTFQWRYKKV